MSNEQQAGALEREFDHFSIVPFKAICGANVPNQSTTQTPERTKCETCWHYWREWVSTRVAQLAAGDSRAVSAAPADELALCPVHKRLDSAGTLECEVGNDCVACSLNERGELLQIIAPFAAEGNTEDSVTVMRRVVDFYATHVGEGRVVASYPAATTSSPAAQPDPAVIEGPSSTEYETWLETRPDLTARFETDSFKRTTGYEIWRNAWLRLRELITSPAAASEGERLCECTDHDPEVCLNGEVDEGQRYCYCKCHAPAPPTQPEGEWYGPTKPLEQIRRELRGEHPEDFCKKCGRPNIVWFGPNAIWNQAVRAANEPEILCPVCFVQLAEAVGLGGVWKVAPKDYDDATPPALPSEQANAAATEICDWCGIDSNDAERVAAIILKHFAAVPVGQERFISAFRDTAIKCHVGFCHEGPWEKCEWIECEDRRNMIAADTPSPTSETPEPKIDLRAKVREAVELERVVKKDADWNRGYNEAIEDALLAINRTFDAYAPVPVAATDSRPVLLTSALLRIEQVATAGERATSGDAAERFKWIRERAAALRTPVEGEEK